MSNVRPSPDWQSEALSVKLRLAESSEATSETLTLDVPVTERNGNLFISSHDVCRAGCNKPLASFDLVSVNNVICEVQGYDNVRREYWIQVLQPE